MSIQFKTKRQEGEYPYMVPKLREVVELVEELFEQLGKPLTITCILRTAKERCEIYGPNKPEGVHEWHRGVDVRTNDLTPEQADAIVEAVNARFFYDTRRKSMKTAQIHEVNGHGRHLHLQVLA